MKRALDLMFHRGPDAVGVWTSPSENIWFGHRRLSILDLSNLGTQPMVSFDGKLVIVFNGEIYNFKSIKNELRKKGYEFRSESDTEVFLNDVKSFTTYEKAEYYLYELKRKFGFTLIEITESEFEIN